MLTSVDHLAFPAFYRTPDVHRHFSKHILFALSGHLECTVGPDTFVCRGLAIQSNVPHTVNASAPPMLVYLLDETSRRAQTLDALYLQGRPYAIFPDELCRAAAACWERCPGGYEAILSLCGLTQIGPAVYDSRIEAVLRYIEQSDTLEAGQMDALCRMVHLSESRLSHLFREQVGLSLASYLTFSKLVKAYCYVLAGETVTQAALHAGFSSSAHFAAVNKKRFGLCMNELGSLACLFGTAEK